MADEKAKSATGHWLSRLQQQLRPGKLLHHRNFFQALPFIFFISALAMLYIANAYYAERTIRSIDRTHNELKELRSEFISTKSDLMLISKQSEVAKAVDTMDLRESIVPPKKIVIREESK
jgi:hypothetical protein